MRKFSNVVVGLVAAGVCVLITYLTLDASFTNILYNLSFLAVMLIIMFTGLALVMRSSMALLLFSVATPVATICP